jgi:hypothetical protein
MVEQLRDEEDEEEERKRPRYTFAGRVCKVTHML